MAKSKKKRGGFFKVFLRLRSYLNIIFLVLLFPLGVISFCLTLLMLSFSLILAATPIFAVLGQLNLAAFQITSFPIKILISLVLCVIGIFLLTLSLYVINGLAFVYKKLLSLFH